MSYNTAIFLMEFILGYHIVLIWIVKINWLLLLSFKEIFSIFKNVKSLYPIPKLMAKEKLILCRNVEIKRQYTQFKKELPLHLKFWLFSLHASFLLIKVLKLFLNFLKLSCKNKIIESWLLNILMSILQQTVSVACSIKYPNFIHVHWNITYELFHTI